ncbi:hypothetical protein DVK00_02930 [Haloarcula sp. Atlit-47R]|uniref:hypothetical protein n=1 Tax=Haloarcula sp. Atlit-47R TaxID=2282132 RepID=UPI000EF1D359|nr:hypothetical protein [Haloarcula sp. Atlit-47R]RLM47478.1 hypothetical protein DVK00_02930 [Haloarcula sp. Atlit-47R]
MNIEDIEYSHILGVSTIETLGGENKRMEVVEVDGENFVLVEDVGEDYPGANPVKKNLLNIPKKLAEVDVNAPKAVKVGSVVVMEYVDGEQLLFTDRDYDEEEFKRVAGAMLGTGNADASRLNILVDSDNELWAVDHDRAGVTKWDVVVRDFKEITRMGQTPGLDESIGNDILDYGRQYWDEFR